MESDEWLKIALATYSDREPRAGMEQRVIRRVANARAARVGRWCAVGVAAAAAFAVVGIRGPGKPIALERPAPVISKKSLSEPLPASVAPGVHRVRVSRRKAAGAFPSAPPITNDERALLTFVRLQPPEELVGFLGPQETLLKPIEIEPVEVEPLEVQ